VLFAALRLLPQGRVLLRLSGSGLLRCGLLCRLLLLRLLLLLRGLVDQATKQTTCCAAKTATETTKARARCSLANRLLRDSACHSCSHLASCAAIRWRGCRCGCSDGLVCTRDDAVHLRDFVENLLARQVVVGHFDALDGLRRYAACGADQGQSDCGELFHADVFQSVDSVRAGSALDFAHFATPVEEQVGQVIFAGLSLRNDGACVGSHRSRGHGCSDGRNLWGSGHRSRVATTLRLLRQSAKNPCGLGVASRATPRGQRAKQTAECVRGRCWRRRGGGRSSLCIG
jgi:hypothetical protein